MQSLISAIEGMPEVEFSGRVKAVEGLLVEIAGPVQALCVGGRVIVPTGRDRQLECEIVGFRDGRALCLPFGPLDGLRLESEVFFRGNDGVVHPSDAWLGRVVNAAGLPLDGKGPLTSGTQPFSLRRAPLPAHDRARVGAPLDVGVRALNTFTTICDGQRMGIFAGSGVGKSVLMSMLAVNAEVDVAVIGLIGERGREVQEFIGDFLGEAGIEKAVVVVATSDEAALMRRQAAYLTLTLAEYFRDSGRASC